MRGGRERERRREGEKGCEGDSNEGCNRSKLDVRTLETKGNEEIGGMKMGMGVMREYSEWREWEKGREREREGNRSPYSTIYQTRSFAREKAETPEVSSQIIIHSHYRQSSYKQVYTYRE